MITGNIENLAVYRGMSKNIDKAIDFILTLEKTDDGDYEIDGKNVYAMINTISPKSLNEMAYESHRKYIDLHYIIDGTEILGYERTKLCTAKNEYDSEEDYQLYSAQGNLIKMKKGDFYIVHPFDAHAPECNKSGEKIKKVIIKIKI